MNLKQILLFALVEPEYSRVEFWMARQKESDYSPFVFWQKLNEYWQFYSDTINQRLDYENSLGNQLTDYQLPLLSETDYKINGHLGLNQLSELRYSLVQYAIENNLLKYYYEYDLSNIHSSGKASPAIDYRNFKMFNEMRFKDELKNKGVNEISDFLSLHLRFFKRKGGDVQEWLSVTKKNIPLDFSTLQKDAFYSWFDNIESENIDKPQQAETKTEQETPTFKNNFDNVSPVEVYKHFNEGLVIKKYLTPQELNKYLKAAFELQKIPNPLFRIKDAPNKTAIEAVFYKYYKNVAGKIHGKQRKYAALLGDYFEGYKTNSVSSNFSKSVY